MLDMKLNVYVPDELWLRRGTRSLARTHPRSCKLVSRPYLRQAVRPHGYLMRDPPARTSPWRGPRPASWGTLGLNSQMATPPVCGLVRRCLGRNCQKFARESQGDLRSWIKPWANTLSFEHAASQETKDAMYQALEDEVLEYDMAALTPEQRRQTAAEHDRLMELFVEELADLVDDWSFRHRTWAWIQGCQQALRDRGRGSLVLTASKWRPEQWRAAL